MAKAARLGIAGLLVSGAIVLASTPAVAADNHTLVVSPGTGTISAAVSAASPGDTLQLEEGTYYDSVFVGQLDAQGNPLPKSLTIRGEGDETVIKPPASSTNPCNSPGSVEGLCVTGQLDAQGNPVLSNPVHDVHISNLRTTGFSDSGVIGFNTEGLDIEHVHSDHNGGYGIARFASTNSLFANNSVSYNGEAGLYVGDSPNAHSVVRDNWAGHNGFGIFLRDSTEVLAQDNAAWGNCVGILALNSGHGATGASGAGQYSIEDNIVTANDQACPSSQDGPPTSGIGIALAGVVGTQVSDNKVTDNKPTGPSLASGGVVIVSGNKGASPASNNVVNGNELDGNQPADIFWDQTGTGNKVSDNNCDTAVPGNLGWCGD
jgi:nitrous oxidase accessory protein NosD